MHIYTWVIVIVLLMALGWVLKRTWLAQERDGDTSEPATASADEAMNALAAEEEGLATQLTSAVRQRIQGLRARIGGAADSDTIVQFREWSGDAFGTEADIQHWLATLNDEQIRALTDHLAEFCNDMGFELEWLLNRDIAQNADLKEGLSQIVRLYSRASFEAVKLQEEVETFRIYHNYMENPQSRANRELGEHLFGKLVEQGMSSVSISEHLAVPSRQRQQQIVETIRHSAVEDPKAFNATLKTVLVERTLAHVNGTVQAVNGTAEAQSGN